MPARYDGLFVLLSLLRIFIKSIEYSNSDVKEHGHIEQVKAMAFASSVSRFIVTLG